MVHSTIRLVLPSDKRGEALEVLTSMAERSRDDPGCVSCRVYWDAQEENVLMVEDVWRSEEDLRRHLRSDDYRYSLLVVDMAIEPPEIRFHAISRSTGIETIEEARGSVG
jgi:quinol monooxygenase YgiN